VEGWEWDEGKYNELGEDLLIQVSVGDLASLGERRV